LEKEGDEEKERKRREEGVRDEGHKDERNGK